MPVSLTFPAFRTADLQLESHVHRKKLARLPAASPTCPELGTCPNGRLRPTASGRRFVPRCRRFATRGRRQRCSELRQLRSVALVYRLGARDHSESHVDVLSPVSSQPRNV